MGALARLLTLSAAVTHAVAEVYTLSLGDKAQYSASLASTPTLTGAQILFTGAAAPNQGVDVVLSDELRKRVEEAVKKDCNTIDTQCFESVKGLLVNPGTTLQSRQVEVFLGAGAAIIGLAAVVLPWIEKDRSQGIPMAVHVPISQLDAAASVGSASTVAIVTGTNAPFVTITPKPNPAATTGADTPTQTTLSSDQDGHSSGDLAIHLPNDLAKRIDEMIERTKDCPAVPSVSVKNFGTQDITQQINAFICAAEALVLNSAPGAALSALSTLNMKSPPWTSPELLSATDSIISFARTQARYMGMDEPTAVTAAIAAAYIVYIRIIKNSELGQINWISASDLKGTPNPITSAPSATITTMTSTSSSSAFECSASCTMVGMIRDCNTWCPTPTPTGADDAPFVRPSQIAIRTVAFDPWYVPIQQPIQKPIGLCPPPPGNATDFPSNQFANVYTNFCDANEGATETVSWIVNSRGEQIGKKARRFRFDRRDGNNDDKYKDYKFTLIKQIPDNSKQGCSTSCNNAFLQLSLQDICKRGDDKSKLANSGYLEAGCASYFFMVDSPPPPEINAALTCRDPKGPFTAPKQDGAASGATSVESAIQQWCTQNDGHALSRDDVVYGRWGITQFDVPGRSSFWPKATLHGSNTDGKIIKDQCIGAFKDGLTRCESEADRTHGFSAVFGSIEYSLELSGWTQEGNPPWNTKASFPPAENQPRLVVQNGEKAGDPYGPECTNGGSRYVHPVDFEKAIDFFCQDGGQLKNPSSKWDDSTTRYPPKGQPRFYENEAYKMYLQLGAAPLDETGGKRPYYDADSCKF